MRECAIAVITRIYSRQDDPSEVEHFVGQLTVLVPDQVPPKDLSRIANAVADILRQIKADRIRKSLEFEAAKVAAPTDAAPAVATPTAPTDAAPTAAAVSAKPREDRRSKSEPVKLTVLTKAAVARKKRRIKLIAGGIAAALVVGGIGTATYVADAPQRDARRKAVLLVEQIQAVGRGESVGTHVYGGTIRADMVGGYAAVVVEGLPSKQCASAGWVFVNRGSIMINGVMPGHASLATLNALCGGSSASATLTWIPRPDSRQKDSKSKK